MPSNTVLLLPTPHPTITYFLRLLLAKACSSLQPLSNGRPHHPSRLSLLMWYITALISQESLQDLVQITCLIDDRLPWAILSEMTGQHPP